MSTSPENAGVNRNKASYDAPRQDAAAEHPNASPAAPANRKWCRGTDTQGSAPRAAHVQLNARLLSPEELEFSQCEAGSLRN